MDATGPGGEGAQRASSPVARACLAVATFGGALGGLLIVVILAITTVSVFYRYFIGRPIPGVDEATGFLVVAVVMFGAADALRRNDHIRIDVLTEHLSARTQRLLDLWSFLSVLVFALVLLVSAWHTVAFSRRFGAYSSGYLELPIWIPQSTMVVGGALLALVALVLIIGMLRRGQRP